MSEMTIAEILKYDRLADPTFFEENRMAAHSDHLYFSSESAMDAGELTLSGGIRYTDEVFFRSLNGVWSFYEARNPEQVPEAAGMDYDCSTWEQIRVPAHIQMEGHGTPQYVNVQYPWEGREEVLPGDIPVRFNPVACYSRTYVADPAFRGERVGISFQGAESALALWVNGVYIGYSEGSFMPAEFDLTDVFRFGEPNKIFVAVIRFTGSSWTEDQDFFRFSGLFRDVFLFAQPKVHISNLSVRPFVDESLASAVVKCNLTSTGRGKATIRLLETGFGDAGEYTADYDKLTSIGAGARAAAVVIEQEISLLAGENETCFEVENPRLWSTEFPSLYKLVIVVKDEAGSEQEYVLSYIGFRRFELKDGLMKLNGKRIVFRGVNRHEFGSYEGRVPRIEDIWKDLVTMKRHNINAIRTSHYPNDSRLYDLCDRLGLYLVDECDLETHGTWCTGNPSLVIPGNKKEWQPMLLDRAQRMYERDKNHPSILIWSCGNEAFGGSVIQSMSDYFHSVDTTRLVQYEGVFNDRSYPDISDIETQMYTPASGVEAWLARDRSKPFLMIEYTHAMGNSCGGMHKYTDLTEREPLFQGGFIWDYIDQSIAKKDSYGQTLLGYGGDFDDRPCDYNFSGNGIAYGGDRNPSPKMQEVKANYSPVRITVLCEEAEGAEYRIVVKNNLLFADTSIFDFKLTLAADGVPIRASKLRIECEAGCEVKIPSGMSVPTGRAGEFLLTVSMVLRDSTLWAAAGHEICFGQKAVAIRASLKERIPTTGSFTVTRGIFNVSVRGENFEVLFNNDLGLVSYVYGGREMLKIPGKPSFWRCPTDNDRGNAMPARYGHWKIIDMYYALRARSWSINENTNGEYFEATWIYPISMTVQAFVSVTYRVYGSGLVLTTVHYDPVAELMDPPLFGYEFRLSDEYELVSWYGKGPDENYCDRCRGAAIGAYRRTVGEGLSEYLKPQECGNVTGVRKASVYNRKGRGLVFFGDEMEFNALPYTSHELENAYHPCELPKTSSTIVRCAKKQMGVGGDDSWGSRPHPEYLLDISQPLDFTFGFMGI